MKHYILAIIIALCLSLPSYARERYFSGVDDIQGDRESKLDTTQRKLLHESVLEYYKDPRPEKIDTLLDLMANTEMLSRRSAKASLIGFLTVVFPNNKNHVMRWMSRNDYNVNAQEVIINSLMHAKMKESALLFAKAHRLSGEQMLRLREMEHAVDLKNLPIILPNHVDTLWGAFFASGETIYVDQIIDAMVSNKVITKELNDAFYLPEDADSMSEIKSLAAMTLRDYTKEHTPVREAIERRMKAEPEASPKYELYKNILGK